MRSPARRGGKATLEALDRANLFLVPLDDRRRWYRYHHLFADVLRARLLDEQPDQVPDAAPAGERLVRAERRAGRGDPPRAGGRRLRPAADLVELAIPAMAQARQEATLRGWLEVLPDEVVRVRPVLSVGFAGALLSGRRVRGRRGSGCETPSGGWRMPETRGTTAGDGRRRRGGVPPPARHDRRVPGRRWR